MVSTASSCEASASSVPTPKRTTIQVSRPWNLVQVRGSKATSTPVPTRSRGGMGPGEGQDQIRAFRDAALAQGDAEIIVVIGDAELAGDIDQPADADGGIDHDAAEGVGGLVAIALQHVIGQHHRRIQVGEGIVDAVAHRLGHRVAIDFGDRAGDGMVQLDVEIEDVAIGLFPGIILGQRLRAGRAARAQGKAQGQRRNARERRVSCPYQIPKSK